MIAERLRKSILQAAIQGRLTEQSPEDGDARDLLAQIQAEKARLIKEGKIKKEKPLPEITEDEIPFNIPENWCWVRLGDVTWYMDSGKSPNCIKAPVKGNTWGVLTTTSIQANFFNQDENKVLPSSFIVDERTKVNAGDLLITRAGPLVRTGVVCVVDFLDKNLILSDKIVRINGPYDRVDSGYISLVINSPVGLTQVQALATGMDRQQVNLSQDKIKLFVIPLPPYTEQLRIMEHTRRVLPSLAKLEIDETKLDALQKAFPKKMKDSLLQSAIQGKLTEQLESDGDARDLVADIQREKARLIKEKKIKAEKPLPAITEDEIPFDIPDNWRWVRLGEMVRLIGGTSYGNADIDKRGIRIIRGGNIIDETCELVFSDDDVFVNNRLQDNDKLIKTGDVVIVASTGSKAVIGKPAFVEADHSDVQIGAFLRIVRPYHNSLIRYARCIFRSRYYREHIRNVTQGTNINNIKAEHITNLTVPLPPLAEQQRIVERLDQLLPLCDTLE